MGVNSNSSVGDILILMLSLSNVLPQTYADISSMLSSNQSSLVNISSYSAVFYTTEARVPVTVKGIYDPSIQTKLPKASTILGTAILEYSLLPQTLAPFLHPLNSPKVAPFLQNMHLDECNQVAFSCENPRYLVNVLLILVLRRRLRYCQEKDSRYFIKNRRGCWNRGSSGRYSSSEGSSSLGYSWQIYEPNCKYRVDPADHSFHISNL